MYSNECEKNRDYYHETFINKTDIDQLILSALAKNKARICLHSSTQDNIQEMLVAMSKDYNFKPIKHNDKVVTFHVIHGSADLNIYDSSGNKINSIQMSKEQNFIIRLDGRRFTNFTVNSDCFVVHEVIEGPFLNQNNI